MAGPDQAIAPAADQPVGPAAGRSEDLPPRDRVLVLVDDLERPELVTEDRRHLERALRLRPGAPVTVADGAGRWRAARLGADVEPVGPIRTAARRGHEVAVGFAPVKGDRSELVIQKLTELGIDVIVALETERSVVRWDDERAERHRRRHERIAREAVMQSRNPWLPRLDGPQPLAAFVESWPGAALADPDGDRGPDSLTGRRAVAVGPEGGFSPAERAGRPTVHLPGHILRTETASIVAGVFLTATR